MRGEQSGLGMVREPGGRDARGSTLVHAAQPTGHAAGGGRDYRDASRCRPPPSATPTPADDPRRDAAMERNGHVRDSVGSGMCLTYLLNSCVLF